MLLIEPPSFDAALHFAAEETSVNLADCLFARA